MRIIAGDHRGQRLLAPPRRGLRPTSDRVREALFSILGARIEGARVLDLYAGTGAVGLEALSRGAAHVDFVEANPQALRVLRGNLARCGATGGAEVHAMTVEAYLRRLPDTHPPYEVIFADPPYEADDALRVLSGFGPGERLAAGGLLVLEHATRAPAPPRLGALRERRRYRYGDTSLTLYGDDAEGVRAQ